MKNNIQSPNSASFLDKIRTAILLSGIGLALNFLVSCSKSESVVPAPANTASTSTGVPSTNCIPGSASNNAHAKSYCKE